MDLLRFATAGSVDEPTIRLIRGWLGWFGRASMSIVMTSPRPRRSSSDAK